MPIWTRPLADASGLDGTSIATGSGMNDESDTDVYGNRVGPPDPGPHDNELVLPRYCLCGRRLGSADPGDLCSSCK